MLLLVWASFAAMWGVAFIALIFYKDGDDRRTLLLVSSAVIAILSVFSMLIPTATVSVNPLTNYLVYNNTGAQTANIIIKPNNVTLEDLPPSNPEITLYSVFAVFLSFIFMALAAWSFKRRLQYYTTTEYKQEMGHKR
jgi:ABC-type antimicrobial peptide transport system permease subunit